MMASFMGCLFIPILDLANPACEEFGCGKWEPPMIANPNYRGKWKPELIDNPNYMVITRSLVVG